MRFREFRVIREAEEGGVYVIGDSIANGIAGAGNVSKNLTDPGKNTSFVLQNLVTPFVKSGKAKGATVILSSGAANSANASTVDGQKIQSENLGPISQQIKMLTDAGAKVVLVGVASGPTPPQKPTQYTKGKNWVVDYSGMNQRLSAIASANGAKFLGPLEEFDPNISKGDGIHPFNGYSKLFKAGSSGAGTNLGPADSKPGAPTTKDRIKDSSDLLQGPPFPPENVDDVKKMQKGLEELGYSVGSLGADGKYGPATAAAVAAFKKDYKLEGSSSKFGDNEFKVLAQIQSGQIAKVKEPTKVDFGGYGSSGPLPELKMDSVTKGKVGEILNLVAGPESRGDYTMMFGGVRDPDILKMTMEQLTDYQLQHARRYGSSAAGRYQIMHFNTLKYARKAGLDPKTDMFSPENQDKMGIVFLRECGLERWLSGEMSDEQFLQRLSMVWAGVPSPSKGGNSYYGGVGLNKANTQLKMNTALAQLDKIGSATA